MELTDIELIKRFIDGEEKALNTLIERYKAGLYSYIIHMAGNTAEADDIFQRTWLKAIKAFKKYREGNFFAWLTRIAHNIIIDQYRTMKSAMSLDMEDEDGFSLKEHIVSNTPSPSTEYENEEIGTYIQQAIFSLPEEQREVLILRLQNGLKFREIAEIQKTSINTVLARMQYALKNLKEILKNSHIIMEYIKKING